MAEHGSSLAGLVAQMGEHARQRNDALAALGVPVGEYPALPVVEDFRRLWATHRQQAQLQASMQPPPADAGPLNSASLAHRALAAMHDSSPGYLQHFMTWLDALAWLDRMQSKDGLPGGKDATTTGQRKRASSGKRKTKTKTGR